MPASRMITACATLVMAMACAAFLSARDDTSSSPQTPFRIVQRGSVMLPSSAPDGDGREVEIMGLSGIAWLGDDRYATIMDNSDKVVLFSMTLARDGTPKDPTDLSVVTLTEHHDYEDVALCPSPLRERIVARRTEQGLPDPGRCLIVCEEDTPAIRVVALADGGLVDEIPLPHSFSRCVSQRALESVHVDADGLHLWTANEEAIHGDGPTAAAGGSTVVRLTRLGLPVLVPPSESKSLQLAYEVDAPHPFVRVFSGEPLSGVTAIAAAADGRLLILERSGCPGLPPFENRIYMVDARDAVDVSAIERDLSTHPQMLVRKVLLWRDQLGCNIEGLTLGPQLRGADRSLIAVADNGAVGTPNQLIAFTLEANTAESPRTLLIACLTLATVLLVLAIYRLAR